MDSVIPHLRLIKNTLLISLYAPPDMKDWRLDEPAPLEIGEIRISPHLTSPVGDVVVVGELPIIIIALLGNIAVLIFR